MICHTEAPYWALCGILVCAILILYVVKTQNQKQNKKYKNIKKQKNYSIFSLPSSSLFFVFLFFSTLPAVGAERCGLDATSAIFESVVYFLWFALLLVLLASMAKMAVRWLIPASVLVWVYWFIANAISGIGLLCFAFHQVERAIRFNPQSLPAWLQPDFDAAEYRDQDGVLLERYRRAGVPVIDATELTGLIDRFLHTLVKIVVIMVLITQCAVAIAVGYLLLFVTLRIHHSSAEISHLVANLLFQKQFCVASSLNGNNGSWTNSDDTMSHRRSTLNNRGTGGKSKQNKGPLPPDKKEPSGGESKEAPKDPEEKEKYVPDIKSCVIYATSADTFLADPYNRMYHQLLQSTHDMEIGIGVGWYLFFSFFGSSLFQDWLLQLFNNFIRHNLHSILLFIPLLVRWHIAWVVELLTSCVAWLREHRDNYYVLMFHPRYSRPAIQMLGRWYRWFDEYNERCVTILNVIVMLLDGFLNANYDQGGVAAKVEQMNGLTTEVFQDIRRRLTTACKLHGNLRARVADLAQAEYSVRSAEHWEYCFAKPYTKLGGQIDLLAHAGVVMAAKSSYDQKLYDAFSKDSRGVVANLTTFKNLMWKAAQHNNDHEYLENFMVSTTTKFLNDVMFDTVAGAHAVGKKEVIMTI